MNFGDTNFIGVANADTYKSFVDEDWELDNLLQHFGDEMKRGHILVFQMTNEGIEYSSRVDVRVGAEEFVHTCFRKAVGYIEVTESQLYLVDYDCLTMAAQFEDNKVPDQNCSKYKMEIENGFYKVEIVQYYNVDKDEYVGMRETDVLMNFIRASDIETIAESVFWCTY
ncbi:hypothetical protein [Oceanobacillus sp. CFH 90083]|uniref:hypothetical protein n=1 Tax=Oceanobacillus sp. CFH 90083 TaxID=2592336 RepID=UPI00128C6BF2